MLRIDNVHVYYGRIHALKGITLTVQTGELVALIGSNGAGKSTTLKTISGLLHPREGTIYHEDRPISGLRPHEIVGLGISHCPEGRHIFGGLTVGENLRLGASRRRDRESIEQDREWIFSLFPVLKERLSQPGGTLSGGEQQMLAIARALMSRPKLLLLDEPSLGLAPLLVERIFDVILQIKQSGGTVLLVEQNAHMALEVADRAYVLETGRITLEGPAAELRTDPEVERAYLGIERRNGRQA
jgi:branched-chain amino acid transport system ATP-binding protein